MVQKSNHKFDIDTKQLVQSAGTVIKERNLGVIVVFFCSLSNNIPLQLKNPEKSNHLQKNLPSSHFIRKVRNFLSLYSHTNKPKVYKFARLAKKKPRTRWVIKFNSINFSNFNE